MRKLNINALLESIDQHLNTIESVGITYAKHNEKAKGPKQKIAIDLATKIGLTLMKVDHYKSACKVAIPLCNMTIAPRKAIAAHALIAIY